MTLEEALKEIEILKLQNKKMGEAFDSLDKKYDSLKLELELAQACHNEKCAEFNKLCFDYAKLQVKNEKFEQKEQIDDGFENYDKLKSQIAFFKEETERAKLSLNKKIEEYNQLSFRFCQQSYEKYKLLSNFAEKLKDKFKEFDSRWIVYSKIDELLKEYKNDN